MHQKIVEDKEISLEEKFKSKLVDVYDLNGFIMKATKNQYESFIWTEMAIIISESGSGLILDKEAVGLKFDSLDEKLGFDVGKYEEEEEMPDGSKVRSVSVYPYGKIKLSINDIRKNAESHQEEAGDFFRKCYGSNWRCEDNLSDALNELKQMGYFDEDNFLESYSTKFTEDDKNDIVREVAKYLAEVDSDTSRDENYYFDEITGDINRDYGDNWIDYMYGIVPWDLFMKYAKLVDFIGTRASKVVFEPSDFIDEEDAERIENELAEIYSSSNYESGRVEEFTELELEKIMNKSENFMLDEDDYVEALTNAIKKTREELKAESEKDTFVESSLKESENKGVEIAKLFFDSFDFGKNKPDIAYRLDGNTIQYNNSVTRFTTIFNDDGSISYTFPDSTGVDQTVYFKSVADLLDGEARGCFIYTPYFYVLDKEGKEQDKEKLISKVKEILDGDTFIESLDGMNDLKRQYVLRGKYNNQYYYFWGDRWTSSGLFYWFVLEDNLKLDTANVPAYYSYEDSKEQLSYLNESNRYKRLRLSLNNSDLLKLTDKEAKDFLKTVEAIEVEKGNIFRVLKDQKDTFVEANEHLSKGEKVARVIFNAFKNECGPFGREDPKLIKNRVGLWSQSGTDWFTFNDDGSIVYDNIEEQIRKHPDVWDYEWDENYKPTSAEIKDIVDKYKNYRSFKDICEDGSGITWFSDYLDKEDKESLWLEISGILDGESFIESYNPNKDFATISIEDKDSDEDLWSISFDRDDDEESVTKKAIKTFKELDPQHKNMELVVTFYDKLADKWVSTSFNNDRVYRVSADEMQVTISDFLDDWYTYSKDWISVSDLSDIIEDLLSGTHPAQHARYRETNEPVESAAICLVAAILLNIPVSEMDKIGFDSEGNWIRILLKNGVSHYFFNRWIFGDGISYRGSSDTDKRYYDDKSDYVTYDENKTPKEAKDYYKSKDTFIEQKENINEKYYGDLASFTFRNAKVIYNTDDGYDEKDLADILQELVDSNYDEIANAKEINFAYIDDDGNFVVDGRLYNAMDGRLYGDYGKPKPSRFVLQRNEKDTFVEDYRRINSKEEEWLDNKIKEHNFKIVSKKDYNIGYTDEKTNVHYQIISNEGNKTKNDLEKEVDWLDDLLVTFENRSGSPCTYNMGLQTDGYISAGFDCRTTSDDYKDAFVESTENPDLVNNDDVGTELFSIEEILDNFDKYVIKLCVLPAGSFIAVRLPGSNTYGAIKYPGNDSEWVKKFGGANSGLLHKWWFTDRNRAENLLSFIKSKINEPDRFIEGVEENKQRYSVQRYGRWQYIIIDSSSGYAYRDSNNKVKFFNQKDKAEEFCNSLNGTDKDVFIEDASSKSSNIDINDAQPNTLEVQKLRDITFAIRSKDTFRYVGYPGTDSEWYKKFGGYNSGLLNVWVFTTAKQAQKVVDKINSGVNKDTYLESVNNEYWVDQVDDRFFIRDENGYVLRADDGKGGIIFFKDEDKAIDYCRKLNKDTYVEKYMVIYKPETDDRIKFVKPFYIPASYPDYQKAEMDFKNKLNKDYLGKECFINHISSLGDFEVEFDDGTKIDRCTMFNFEPLEHKPELYHLIESYVNKNNNKTCDILKDFKNGYVLVKYEDGTKDIISTELLSTPDTKSEDKLNVLDVEVTKSFEDDYDNLSNKQEAKWFEEESGSNSLLVLQRLGLQNTIRAGKCKQESISNNSIVDNGVTVYSLFKGSGSGNQFRAYFYRKGDKCIFVRCLLKKRTQNGPEEYKAIRDTAEYAKNH